MRSRAERYALMLTHRAVAAALEASLKNDAAGEYEREGVRVTWDLPDGQVVASLRHDAIEVTDEAAFLEWLAVAYSHQVERVCRLEVINPNWVSKTLLASLEPIPEDDEDDVEIPPASMPAGSRLTAVDPSTGTVVPGVRWTRGGGLASVSVKPNQSVMRGLNLAAAAYVEGAGPMPGLESGEKTDGN